MPTEHSSSPAPTLSRGQTLAAIGGFTTASIFSTIGIVRAAAPKVVRVGDVVAEDNPEIAAHKFFGDRLKQLTNGEYELKIFPNSVLGGHTSMNEQCRAGTLEFAKSGSGFPTTYDKRLGVINLPYLYSSKEKLFAALDGQLGRAYSQVSEQYGLKTLGFYDSGVRHMYNKKGPIHEPGDIKKMGLRMRTQPDRVMIATLNQLGAQATPLESGETYNAIQQGVVDGAENSITFYLTTKHNEVAPYFSKTSHFFSIDPFFVSLKWFNQQPKSAQNAIVQAMRETIPQERKLWAAGEKASYDKAASVGVKINDADVPALRKAALPVWGQFKSDLGTLYAVLEKTQG